MTTRIVMIAGSGELSPGMAPVHRKVIRRLADGLGRPVRAVALDTPYGFQENAEQVTERTVSYFRNRVRLDIEPVSMLRSGSAALEARATEAIRRADFVFAGPGSPSYALKHWRASGVGSVLRKRLEDGAALSVASAAAITLGAFALPVYEIYKAGEDPHWLPGLDLLSHAGLRVAVVPHFDNREGGTHDTRYCFIGERRFRMLEARLPPEAWVLGVDENTALIIDLDAARAEVKGRGTVTVRRNGTSRELRAGTSFAVSELVPRGLTRAAPSAPRVALPVGPQRLERTLEAAADAGDVSRTVAAVLELEEAARASELPDGREERSAEVARLAVRSGILRLGELAARGRSDAVLADAVVDALVSIRARARETGDWATADEIRDALSGVGVSLRDTEAGPVWERIG